MIKILPKIFLSVFFTLLFMVITQKSIYAATLTLSPATKNVSLNEIFSVNVMLNTGGSDSDGVDAILTFDNSRLQFVSATLGSLFDDKQPITTPTGNTITLRATTSTAGTNYNGTGTFATINFKAISAGTAAIKFNFTSGGTTDSNVAYLGDDLLTSTNNGSYIIGSSSATSAGTVATPTPNNLPTTGVDSPTILVITLGLLLLSSPLIIKKII